MPKIFRACIFWTRNDEPSMAIYIYKFPSVLCLPLQNLNKTPGVAYQSPSTNWAKLPTRNNSSLGTRFRTQQIWGEKKKRDFPSLPKQLAKLKLLPKCQQEEVLVIPARHKSRGTARNAEDFFQLQCWKGVAKRTTLKLDCF